MSMEPIGWECSDGGCGSLNAMDAPGRLRRCWNCGEYQGPTCRIVYAGAAIPEAPTVPDDAERERLAKMAQDEAINYESAIDGWRRQEGDQAREAVKRLTEAAADWREIATILRATAPSVGGMEAEPTDSAVEQFIRHIAPWFHTNADRAEWLSRAGAELVGFLRQHSVRAAQPEKP